MRLLLLIFLLLIPLFGYAEINLQNLVKDRWLEVRTANFIIITDAKQKRAIQLAKDLEKFRYFIAHVMQKPMIKGGHPLRVLAVESQTNFKHLDLPQNWSGAFYRGALGDYVIASTSDYSLFSRKGWGYHVLMHEYVHFAIRNMLDSNFYPEWYEEGVAEYLASFNIKDGGERIAIGATDAIADRLKSLSGIAFDQLNVEALFKSQRRSTLWRRGDKDSDVKINDLAHERLFYARALITYHYLQSSKSLQNQLAEYIRLLNQDIEIDIAFQRAFDTTYEAMNSSLRDYINSGRLVAWNINNEDGKFSFPEANPTFKALSVQRAYAELAVAMLGYLPYDEKEKEAILRMSLEHGERTPELAIAQLLQQESRESHLPSRRIGRVQKLLAQYPNNTELQALLAEGLTDKASMQLMVGHPQAKRNLSLARNAARTALAQDIYNPRAHRTLARATLNDKKSEFRFIDEAVKSVEPGRLLSNAIYAPELLRAEVTLNLMLARPQPALRALRRYALLVNDYWISEGTGHLLHEALAANDVLSLKAEVTSDGLNYADGSIYKGEIRNGKAHGTGRLTTHFGANLTGYWEFGRLVGRGELQTSQGVRYLGGFADGFIMGQGRIEANASSAMVFNDGEFYYGLAHGHQHRVYRDGRALRGIAEFGVYQGTHSATLADGTERLLELRNGAAVSQLNNRLVFAGAWNKHMQPHGWGVCWNTTTDLVWNCELQNGEIVDGESDPGVSQG